MKYTGHFDWKSFLLIFLVWALAGAVAFGWASAFVHVTILDWAIIILPYSVVASFLNQVMCR